MIGHDVSGTSQVQNLVNVWGGSTVDIYGNDLHNALTVGTTPTWSSPAILVTSYGGSGDSHANIHDNVIYSSDTGVVVGSVYATTDNSTADVTKNTFKDLNSGVSFESATASATINENSFTNVGTALTADDSVTPRPAVNADRNWWGADADPRTTGQAYAEAQIANWYVDADMKVLNTDRGSRRSGSGGGGGRSSGSTSTGSTGTGTTGGGQVLGAAIFNFTTDLHFGSRGTDVTELQTELIAAGFSIPAGPTGYFGVQTRAAVAAWQAANGVLPSAGYFGPISRAKYVANDGFGAHAAVPATTTTTTTTTVGSTTTATSTTSY